MPALAYDTALIVQADLVRLTGQQDLANLEADAELDLDALILSAHRRVFAVLRSGRYLSATGETRDLPYGAVDPTALVNGERIAAAEAWEVLSRLAAGGYLDPLVDREATVEGYARRVERELIEFEPDLPPPAADEEIVDAARPALANLDRVPRLYPEQTTIYGDLPGVS